MIQVLYAHDHTDRGVALAGAIPGGQGNLVTDPPVARQGLHTLTLWGHGDILRLCGMLVDEAVDLVREWKALNPDMKTVEIITCNARHAPTGYDSYSRNLAQSLRSGFRSRTRNIAVKALPTNVGGAVGAFSILLAHAPNRSWCYITAPGPNDSTMFQGVNLVREEANGMGYDLAQAADRIGRSRGDRRFTLNYGYFNTLRAHLGVVR